MTLRMKAEPISSDSAVETPTHFLQVIRPATLEEKKLMIPQKFVRDFGNELSPVATLTVPNGRVWHVGLAKDGGKIWFYDGWHEFVEYHSISAGYFLVFRYEKISIFNVLIFDITTCEIRYPYYCGGLENVMQNSERGDGIKIDNFVEMVSPTTPNPQFRSLKNEGFDAWPSNGSSSKMYATPSQLNEAQPSFNSALGISEWQDCAASFDGPNFNHGDETQSKNCIMEEFVAINELNAVNKSNQGKSNNIEMYNSQGSLHCKRHPSEHAVSKSKTSYSGEDGIPAEVGDECDLSALLEDMGIFISRHFGSITAEQRERAINVARLLKPKNPAFMVILRSRSIKKSCLMYVPAKFANKHLSRDTKFVKLQDSIGKEWPEERHSSESFSVSSHCIVNQKRIPEKFVRKFGDELSDVALFRVPNGRVWHVGLTKDGSKILFNDGWDDFVKYHSIGVGYFLVFKYGRNTNFDVLILGTTYCEIEYPYNGENVENHKQKSQHEIKSEDSVEIMDLRTPNPLASPLKKKCFNKRTRSFSKTCPPPMKQNQAKPPFRSAPVTDRRRKKCAASLESPTLEHGYETRLKKKCKMEKLTEINESNVVAENQECDLLEEMGIIVSRRFAGVSAEERARIINASQLFKPKCPSFVIILRARALAKRTVYVPYEFAVKYLSRDANFIKLRDQGGREWPVRVIWRDCGGPFMRFKWKQWDEFSKEKNLEVGDIWLFEIIRKEDYLMKISVFPCKSK
ncbi:hypothetical protein ACOSP7_005395 [Xanthoceras sorbifolium]